MSRCNHFSLSLSSILRVKIILFNIFHLFFLITSLECNNGSLEKDKADLSKFNINSLNNANTSKTSATTAYASPISSMPLNYSIHHQPYLSQQQQQQQQCRVLQQQFQVPPLQFQSLEHLLQQQQHHSQSQQQMEENPNDTTHDDTQYDSTLDLGSSSATATTPFDYSNNKCRQSRGRSRDTSESICESDEDDGEDGEEYGNYDVGESENHDNSNNNNNNNSSIYNVNNNDTSSLNETCLSYKPTGNSEQNEKNLKKSKVIDLYTKGERCVRKLSQLTGVPLTTVYRVIGKLKGINYNIPRGNGAGRKTILDTQDREILVEILSTNPRISRKALGKELEKLTGKSIHNSTLNRELCRLRHQVTAYPSAGDSSLNTTKSPSTTPQMKQSSPPTIPNRHSKQQQQHNQLAIETNNSTIPQLSSSSSTTSSMSTTSSTYMAKDLIGIKSLSSASSSTSTKSNIKDQDQQSKPLSLVSQRINTPTPPSPSSLTTQQSLLTPSMLAAAAAALAYPTSAASRLPIMSQIQSPFNNINAAALAAYSSLFNNATDQALNAFAATQAINHSFASTSSPLDLDITKQIALAAQKFSDSLYNIEAKPLSNIKPEIATQLMELINGDHSNDKATYDDTIRRLAGILIQRPVERNYYENCLNETLIQLCIIKPALLTRRDDLTLFGKQILDSLGIVENGKR